MKTLLFVLLLMGASLPGVESLEGLRNDARQHEKNIAVYFSGSDWCTNCHRFRRNVLEQDTIKSLLDNGYVYYVADFPQRKKLDKETVSLNEALAEKLNPDGVFPVLVLTDSDWNIKARIYNGNALETIMHKLKSNATAQ
ncbi:thioredoxin family protein [Taibaiella chishuiensis]|uniref:Thioredoxin-like protein n=1 Tax=Taibaiella chishuiensis TaxID=1434707 RepID=A0A2P8D8A2_9BACT|nr:thioredoxin family protein [Taibaiella chishuiensis]PSK93455.1 thioredoxin-like protein [Taibaiella chishuiensis]